MDAADLARELGKILDVLAAVGQHLDAKDEMNAALHMSGTVRATPLAAAVGGATADLADLIRRVS
jgi:hypothetical protein